MHIQEYSYYSGGPLEAFYRSRAQRQACFGGGHEDQRTLRRRNLSPLSNWISGSSLTLIWKYICHSPS